MPLSYSPTTAGIVVLSGFVNGGAWAHNLRARPEAEVQVGRRTYGVRAVEITDPLQAERSTRAVLRDAGVAGFCYGWDPRRASSDRIRRVMPGLVSFDLRFHEPPPWAVCRP